MRNLSNILNEVLKSIHFNTESYNDRITKSWTDDGALDAKTISVIDKRIRFLDVVEFNIPSSGLGVKIYSHDSKVYYDDYPDEARDWGVDLWLIVKGNKIITAYWKPTDMLPKVGDFIDIKELKDKVKFKNIGSKRNPVRLNLLK